MALPKANWLKSNDGTILLFNSRKEAHAYLTSLDVGGFVRADGDKFKVRIDPNVARLGPISDAIRDFRNNNQ